MNDPFATSPQERGFYQQLFLQLDKDKTHQIPHDVVLGYHSQSGLPRPVLEKLFAMSDLDKDGKLDFAEFVIMTHILFVNRRGVPLPVELPKSLIPPSKAHLVSTAPVAPAAPVVEESEEESEEEEEAAEEESEEESVEEEPKKNEDVFDFGFGSSAPAAPAAELPAPEQPLLQIAPAQPAQPPMMPQQPAHVAPVAPAAPAPEPVKEEESNPDETKDKKYLWLKWCQNRRDLKKREGVTKKKSEDIAAKEAVNNELRMQIEEAKECLERKQNEVKEHCGCWREE